MLRWIVKELSFYLVVKPNILNACKVEKRNKPGLCNKVIALSVAKKLCVNQKLHPFLFPVIVNDFSRVFKFSQRDKEFLFSGLISYYKEIGRLRD